MDCRVRLKMKAETEKKGKLGWQEEESKVSQGWTKRKEQNQSGLISRAPAKAGTKDLR